MLWNGIILLAAVCAAGLIGLRIGRRYSVAPPDARPPEGLRPVPLDTTDEAGGSLALLDVDDLNGVNRDEDFDTGDRLLAAMGDILRRALGPGQGMERLESGRFLLWLPGQSLEEAADLTRNLRRLASNAIVDGRNGPVARSLSAGVVSLQQTESRARAILHADAALARAKKAGGDRLEVVRNLPTPSSIPSRGEVEAALESEALAYHVQPIFDLRTDRAVGVEALLRWTRQDGRVEGPGGFLTTLDTVPEAGSDLFPALAEQAARRFTDSASPLYCTFNITGAVIDGKESGSCRYLSALLERIPNDRLVLEIVESAVIIRPERAIDLITRLRDRGARVALDDFGTGHSNLERLRRFPVDIIKIDRVFVDTLGQDGRSEGILRGLAGIGRDLDMDIIAEGIETAEQARILSELDIHFGQGYHIGRPAPAEEWQSRLLSASAETAPP